MSEESGDEQVEKPRGRRILRGLILSAVGALLFIALALVAARVYFNDERLREMLVAELEARLRTDVAIEGFNLELLGGFELTGLRIGPPEGFTKDLATVGRAALHYSLLPLLRGSLLVHEFAVEDLTVILEENEHGRNVDALSPPAEPRAPSSDDRERERSQREKKTETVEIENAPPVLDLPSLPIAVQVEHISFGPMRAEAYLPELTATIDRIRLVGDFRGQGTDYRSRLWMGLGDPDARDLKSTLTLQKGDELIVEGEQRFATAIDFAGLDSLAVRTDFDATTKVDGKLALPPIESKATIVSKTDLLTQRLELETLNFSVGERTSLKAKMLVEGFLGDPKVRLDAFRAETDLDELAPIVAALEPKTSVGGKLAFEILPATVPSVRTERLVELALSAIATTENFRAQTPQGSVEDLDSLLEINLDRNSVRARLEASMASATTPAASAQSTGLNLEVTTPLSPWLAPYADAYADADGLLELSMVATVDGASAGPSTATQTRLETQLDAPVSLLKGSRSPAPLHSKGKLSVAAARSGAYGVNGVVTSWTAESYDLAGLHSKLQSSLRIQSVSAVMSGGNRVSFPNMGMSLALSRNGDTVDMPSFDLSLAEVLVMHSELRASRISTRRPRISRFTWEVAPCSIEELLALIPPSLRPPQQISGTVSLSSSAQGIFPLDDLAPKLASGATWTEQMDNYGTYLEAWAGRFERGMPFTARFEFDAENVNYLDVQNDLKGLSADLDFDVLDHGMEGRLALHLATMKTPSRVDDLSVSTTFGFHRRVVTSTFDASVGRANAPTLPRPVENATMHAAGTYSVGGDLAVEEFAVRLPDRKAHFVVSGLVGQPLRVARNRSWLAAGMPGVDVSLRWDTALENEKMEPLAIPGPPLKGGLGLKGRLSLRDGIFESSGQFSSKNFSTETPAAAVSGMDGALPFRMAFAFRDAEGFTALARPVAVGGGRLWIRTSGAGGANRRPPYYERIRRYTGARGLRIREISAAGYLVNHLELDGRLEDAALTFERLRLSVLGGDITGSADYRLTSEAAVQGTMEMKVSNLDASYFSALDLEPGAESELDADFSTTFFFAEKRRDLTMSMNVTKIGSNTLDRFLRLLDPNGSNKALQDTRGNLDYVTIENLAMWIAYENLNMDIAVNTFLRIPFTSIGYPNIDRELLRRYSLAEYFDLYLDPAVDKSFASLLGWNRGG